MTIKTPARKSVASKKSTRTPRTVKPFSSQTAQIKPIKNVVLFADDQDTWHTQVDRTKKDRLPKLTKILANCDVRSATHADLLFTCIETALAERDVETIIVFLDLNFPDIKTGLSTLNRLRRNTDERIRQIPVFVYSVSRDPSEIAAVQMRGGNGYYHKVQHPYTFWEALESIDASQANHWPKPRSSNDVTPSKRPANDMRDLHFLG